MLKNSLGEITYLQSFKKGLHYVAEAFQEEK